MSTTTKADAGELQQLARKREDAADALEAAVAALGIALGRFNTLTAEVAELAGPHIGRRLEVPLILHLRKAGLTPFLDRKLTGESASLRSIVAGEHEGLTST